MTRSAKGDSDNHGKNVTQKSGLNRTILDQGWGEFKRQIEYKQEWRGGWLLLVDPKHTSQICSVCKHTAKENRNTQSEFRCVACGHEANADVNAAQNIFQRGMDWLSGESVGKVKKTNRGTHGDRLPSEWRKPSATGKSLRYEELATQTNLTQPLQAA